MPQDKKKLKLKRVNKVTFAPKTSKAKGGFVDQYQDPIAIGGNLAGSLLEASNPTSKATGALSGALKGAGALAPLGPIGMGVGAVAGGIGGFIKAKKEGELEDSMLEQKGLATQKQLMANAKFKHGGKILSKKLGVQGGGNLVPISDDAVEVQADNPNLTDSVELDSAFVDNNEVIDRSNRVFSDSVIAPSGRTVAKEAKRLQKMKAEDSRERFKAANNHINNKLDALFNYQEAHKKVPMGSLRAQEEGEDPFAYMMTDSALRSSRGADLKKTLESMNEKDNYGSGGKIHIKKSKVGSLHKHLGVAKGEKIPASKLKIKSTDSPAIRKKKQFAINARKWKHADGGIIGNENWKNPVDINMPEFPGSVSTQESQGFDFQPLTNNLATFGPNIVSAYMQSKLKGPASPVLEGQTKLSRIDVNPQLAELNRDVNSAQQIIGKNTAQGADLISETGSLLAKKLNAKNAIYGQANATNANIANNEAFLNTSTRARNVERLNEYNAGMNEFSNAKRRLTTENISNLSAKIMARNREKNLQTRDTQALGFLSSAYGDSGVLSRLEKANPTLAASIRKSLGMKMGGKLYSKNC